MSGDLLLGIGIGALAVVTLGVLGTTLLILILRTATHHPQAFIGDLDQPSEPDVDEWMRRQIEQHGGHA